MEIGVKRLVSIWKVRNGLDNSISKLKCWNQGSKLMLFPCLAAQEMGNNLVKFTFGSE